MADVPGVGQNLQDHVSLYGLAWTVKPGTLTMSNAFSFPVMSQYVHQRKGPFSVHVILLGECSQIVTNTVLFFSHMYGLC